MHRVREDWEREKREWRREREAEGSGGGRDLCEECGVAGVLPSVQGHCWGVGEMAAAGLRPASTRPEPRV